MRITVIEHIQRIHDVDHYAKGFIAIDVQFYCISGWWFRLTRRNEFLSYTKNLHNNIHQMCECAPVQVSVWIKINYNKITKKSSNKPFCHRLVISCLPNLFFSKNANDIVFVHKAVHHLVCRRYHTKYNLAKWVLLQNMRANLLPPSISLNYIQFWNKLITWASSLC